MSKQTEAWQNWTEYRTKNVLVNAAYIAHEPVLKKNLHVTIPYSASSRTPYRVKHLLCTQDFGGETSEREREHLEDRRRWGDNIQMDLLV